MAKKRKKSARKKTANRRRDGKSRKKRGSSKKGAGHTGFVPQEEKYWREQHPSQAYADKNLPFEHYAPAYRTGIEAAGKYPGKGFEEIEDEVILDYQRHRIGAALPWDHARHAVHAAWAKLSQDIGPRDSSRGIRSGF